MIVHEKYTSIYSKKKLRAVLLLIDLMNNEQETALADIIFFRNPFSLRPIYITLCLQ